MSKKLQKTFVLMLVGFLIAPHMALAAWWNPLTWFKKPVSPPRQVQNVVSTSTDSVKPSVTKETSANSKTDAPQVKENAQTKKTPVKESGKVGASKKVLDQTSEIENLKKEVEELKRKKTIDTSTSIKQPTPPASENTQSQSKNSVVNLPNGAVAEMDARGNIVRYIKEPPQQYTSPTPPAQNHTLATVEISSTNVTPTITSAKVEWQTDKTTESKVFLSGGGLAYKVFNSNSGLSTRHSALVEDLNSNTEYTYEIEAISNSISYKKRGTFRTLLREVAELVVKAREPEVFGSNCGSAFIYAYTEDQAGNFLPSVPVRFTHPETGQVSTVDSVISNESGKVALASFSYSPQEHASKVKSQTLHVSSGKVQKSLQINLRATPWENVPPTMKQIMLTKKASWLDSLTGESVTEENYLGQSVSFLLKREDWRDTWEFVDTSVASSHADKLKARGYVKNTAWFSSRAGMYFDPDTSMCI